MINFKSFILLFVSLIIGISSAEAQDRKFVNEFLNIGVGAKSLSMFGAVTAKTDDISAAYWNPAGLLNIEAPFQVSAMHSEWFAGIAQYDYLAFGKKLGKDKNSFGSVSLIRMGVDNIPNTFNLVSQGGKIVDYDQITQFSAADYALIISYAKKAFGNISVGGSTKIIYRQIGQFGSAWGFGFDFGTQMKFKNISVGIMGRDITSTFMAWSFNFTDKEKDILLATGNEIPKSSIEYALPKIIAGVAYEGFLGKSKNISYLLELDANLSTDGRRAGLISSNYLDITPAMGFELGYKKKVYLRAGMGNLQRVLVDITGKQAPFEFQPNVGVGLKLGRLHLDYALSNVGELSSSLYSHIFSLSLDLIKNKKQEE